MNIQAVWCCWFNCFLLAIFFFHALPEAVSWMQHHYHAVRENSGNDECDVQSFEGNNANEKHNHK